MKIKLFLSLFLAIFLLACKGEKQTEQVAVEKPVDSKVKIVVDMIVPKDDSFQIFYTEDGTSVFNEEKSVRVNVKGQPTTQKIVFNFPEDVAFSFLRFDVGENKEQQQMKIENFTVDYFGKKFEAKGNLFFQFFAPNEQLTVDMNGSTFVPKKSGNIHDPIFYPLEPLGVELEKLVKS
ncbi:hypothetical protein [Flavobacterium aurantiibacter]|uniref:Uncharacterized protein n=1 Tax=Flavobacterium aurantiibacter TaxID=2023067 RepID=A0A255ZJ96_9FLAO|nr:hypothetical protein [Flavobacterium aurantiibacter]OYQ41556.1 hypothetical protein CHX27_12860 [Flavobacterium aurantiibacter]